VSPDRRSTALSRTISYALRHHPEEFGLQPDAEGWVGVDDLLGALRRRRQWDGVSPADLGRIVESGDKQRFEMANGRIRALYGHSGRMRIERVPAEPPDVLYHGTTRAAASMILHEGLGPMRRQFVHLSIDVPTALAVGRRRDTHPVILRVDAAAAYRDGVHFYEGNEQVWLADAIPARYVSPETAIETIIESSVD
jgi:putative RNA 2'-phosphotransferase